MLAVALLALAALAHAGPLAPISLILEYQQAPLYGARAGS